MQSGLAFADEFVAHVGGEFLDFGGEVSEEGDAVPAEGIPGLGYQVEVSCDLCHYLRAAGAVIGIIAGGDGGVDGHAAVHYIHLDGGKRIAERGDSPDRRTLAVLGVGENFVRE